MYFYISEKTDDGAYLQNKVSVSEAIKMMKRGGSFARKVNTILTDYSVKLSGMHNTKTLHLVFPRECTCWFAFGEICRCQCPAHVRDVCNAKYHNQAQQIATECTACHSTGLSGGHAHKGAAAVVCSSCDGTGKITIEHHPFIKRYNKPGTHKVFGGNPGYPMDENTRGGVLYEEWKRDPDSVYEIDNAPQDLACPAQWGQLTSGKSPGPKELGRVYRCWSKIHPVQILRHENDVLETPQSRTRFEVGTRGIQN